MFMDTLTTNNPHHGLFLQELDKNQGLQFFMPQDYVWGDMD